MRTAMSLVTFMVGMNIRACKSTDESSDKTSFACLAGMNTETYDTEAVPYHKQQCAESEDSIFHTDLQSYKKHRICKTL